MVSNNLSMAQIHTKLKNHRITAMNLESKLSFNLRIDKKTPDKIRKITRRIFENVWLDIGIKINLKEVDFPDVTLNLRKGIYQQYRKSNDKLLYIHLPTTHRQ